MDTTVRINNTPPNHIAIIMDGNGRWAERRGLSRLDGHKAGLENARQIIRHLNSLGVKYVTLYSFSTENWKRPDTEIKGLFGLINDIMSSYIPELVENNVRLKHLGHLDKLPSVLKDKLADLLSRTSQNTGLTLCLAFDYGGRDEIIQAVKKLVKDGLAADKITENVFDGYLYTAGIPEADLVIRTGGEMRLSNFLLWQSAYSELYFSEVMWPDFGEKEIDKAISAFNQRQRRFGGL
ncbi:MAG: undecaprenyl diphosphate synthase [Dehalococcoides mccartyi]|uniref:isoprenyl transferase n=1 Tax=Dehalococcoides mccartyi TaxID=61435 RepID=UPI0008048979|nr:isoprenyl transferase [Dehalococcoides mccartyi]MCF7634786.1 undecaprenyl diphosphate synthase [Dehalococcoides mccartyi]MEA2121560.1 Ditrans,polycis-undecaprenyl-diphosphate synthase ((2E,6E)-farnesyl-diphosphate specific) [Dehalococcoides mccartyi]MEA2122973.1 Ditrans,polycis-undecaprenyl-diphosphate synthase ((2E,6E)-farnesyl-diphosphate specific) [Dehalococcoides mccartyi]OBW62326.1 MAG: di-trans,poly-cis-decaprenylcistransferase [Dehalococcoides mccartyi]